MPLRTASYACSRAAGAQPHRRYDSLTGEEAMQLPYVGEAMVPLEKSTGYLLNDADPDARGKAEFFRRFGFRRDQPEILQAALRQLAQDAEMTELRTAFGLKYVGAAPWFALMVGSPALSACGCCG